MHSGPDVGCCPGSPTAEAMVSNTIQCRFESDPGYLRVGFEPHHEKCRFESDPGYCMTKDLTRCGVMLSRER
jgi:hypothetical protein